jgi:hypothetical protein
MRAIGSTTNKAKNSNSTAEVYPSKPLLFIMSGQAPKRNPEMTAKSNN